MAALTALLTTIFITGLTNHAKSTVITHRKVSKLFKNFGNFIATPLPIFYINIKTAPPIIINEILFQPIPPQQKITLSNGVNIYAKNDQHYFEFTVFVNEFPKL